MIEKYFDTLGRKATDKITGVDGVITSLSFDLYGCITCILTPHIKDNDKNIEAKWYDIQRLDIDYNDKVMHSPDFLGIAVVPSNFSQGGYEKSVHQKN